MTGVPAAVLLLSALMASTAQAAAPPPMLWADFSAPSQHLAAAPVRPIALSERPGDAQADAVTFADAFAHVAGRLSKARGSQWATLGIEVAGPQNPATDLARYASVRVRLASAVPRVLRIRLKGADPRILKLGCYPVMMQQVGPHPTDYVIPLSAFEPEPYCAERGASVEQTLPAVTAVEVTANEPSDDPVRFAVGRIEFLSGSAAAPATAATRTTRGADWTLAWSDEFDAPAGQGVDANRWSLLRTVAPAAGAVRALYADSPREAAHDGRGHLQLQARNVDGSAPRCADAPCTHVSAKLQAQAAGAMLYGRMEVRFKAPAVPGLSAQIMLLGAPLAELPWPDAGEITLAETHGRSPSATVGLYAPTLGDGAQRSPVAWQAGDGGAAGAFHTAALEWDPNGLRWLLDDVPVKTIVHTDLPASAREALEQWPYLLQIGLAVGDEDAGTLPARLPSDAALLIDYVRLYRRADLDAAARLRMAAWQARRTSAPATAPATAAANARTRPAPARRAAVPAASEQQHTPQAAPRQVVCERNNKHGLMMCY